MTEAFPKSRTNFWGGVSEQCSFFMLIFEIQSGESVIAKPKKFARQEGERYVIVLTFFKKSGIIDSILRRNRSIQYVAIDCSLTYFSGKNRGIFKSYGKTLGESREMRQKCLKRKEIYGILKQIEQREDRRMKKSPIVALLCCAVLFCACEVPNEYSEVASSEFASSSVSDSADISQGHKDEDGDGICDICRESVTVTFDFFAVNDLHGKFDDTDEQIGVDELTTYLRSAKAQNENTVILSSGDMWQGSSESNLTKGMLMTDWMNEVGFASMTLGNHEYDWGESVIESNASQANFPFLALNVYDKKTNKLAEYCQSSVMVEQNGVKIGIIGAIGEGYSSISSDKVQDVTFKTGKDLTALVKAESRKLRAQGADCIVYSLHDGYGSSENAQKDVTTLDYYDVALSDGYVDLVFEGHTHQRYVLRDGKGVYHLQGGGENKGISHAEVTINYVNDTSIVHTAEFVSTSRYASLQPDPIVDELLEKYEEEIALANKQLGYNAKYRPSYELCETVAKLYYETGLEKWGEQYEIVLGGGFLSARSPWNLQIGNVAYRDIQSIFPFDNEIVLCSISGYNLKYKFFETTNDRYHIAYGEYGADVKNSIDLNATYYIVTDTYTSQYKYNNWTKIATYDATTYARDLLAEYIEAGGFAE